MTSSTEVSLADLESHLWESTDILRGPVDAADRKTYIFPPLFFKSICDVWEDEYQQTGDATGGEQPAWLPELHRFQIPEHCHWNDVRTKVPRTWSLPCCGRCGRSRRPIQTTRAACLAAPGAPTSNESPTVCGRT